MSPNRFEPRKSPNPPDLAQIETLSNFMWQAPSHSMHRSRGGVTGFALSKRHSMLRTGPEQPKTGFAWRTTNKTGFHSFQVSNPENAPKRNTAEDGRQKDRALFCCVFPSPNRGLVSGGMKNTEETKRAMPKPLPTKQNLRRAAQLKACNLTMSAAICANPGCPKDARAALAERSSRQMSTHVCYFDSYRSGYNTKPNIYCK